MHFLLPFNTKNTTSADHLMYHLQTATVALSYALDGGFSHFTTGE